MRLAGKTMALSHSGRGGFSGGSSLSGSQADLGDYSALLARLKEMIGWDDSARLPDPTNAPGILGRSTGA